MITNLEMINVVKFAQISTGELKQLSLWENNIGPKGFLHLAKAKWIKISNINLGNSF